MLRSKAIVLIGLLMAVALVLTACPAAAPGDTGGGDAATGERREVTWMVRTGPEENKWEQEVVVPAFEEAHPDLKINLLIIDQDDIAVKREAMIAAGEPLHVWSTNWGGDGFASDRDRGLITDLTPLIERDNVDTSVFIPEVLDIYENDGKIWGLPFLTTGSYLFYNMDLFDEVGVDYPTSSWDDTDWTWDAAMDLARDLTQNPDDPMSAVYGWNEGVWPVEGITWPFDAFPWPDDAFETGFADSIDFTSEGAIEAFQTRHDMMYVDKVMPDGPSAQALSQLGGTFESGRVAMMTTGGWGWWEYSDITPDIEGGFCWGVAPIPYGAPDSPYRAVIFTDPWVITAGLEGQELEDAWTLVKFLISEEQARAYMQATNTPPTQSKLQEEWFQQFGCMDAEQVREVYQGAFSNGLESSNHLMIRFDEINGTWDNMLAEFWNTPDMQATDILPDVEAAVNDVLLRIQEESGMASE